MNLHELLAIGELINCLVRRELYPRHFRHSSHWEMPISLL